MANKNDGNHGNEAAAGLAKYLRHDGLRSGNDDGSQSADEAAITRRHALEQLVESQLGADLSAAAQRLMAVADESSSSNEFSDGANKLTDSSSFRQLQDTVLQLPIMASSSMVIDEVREANNDRMSSSKKAKTPQQKAAAPAPAPTSFSLFDMLDSQKGAFSLPPRIMAHQIIETYEREKQTQKQNNDSTNNNENCYVDGSGGGGNDQSTLELLEKADDIEDLSPDSDSWEEVRRILYEGLASQNNNLGSSRKEAFRYLKVHKTLLEKCRGNNACDAQSWSLAQNLVGVILSLACRFEDKSNLSVSAASTKRFMDLCWDIMQTLLDTLSHLATDYVVSSVGNEREIERMLLGMCLILSNDNLACILGMMEPMAGWFEVWSRFVDPCRFIIIIHASGIAGKSLHRCDRTVNTTSYCKNIWSMIQMSTGDEKGSASLADIEHCNFIQSLSILRTILFRCGGSQQIVHVIHDQFTNGQKDLISTIPFFLSHGVASSHEVHTLLMTYEEDEARKPSSQSPNHTATREDIDSVLKPFRSILRAKDCNAGLISHDLEVMCTQTIQLYANDIHKV